MSKHTPGPWLQWAGTNVIITKHSGGPDPEDLRICEVATNTRRDEGRHNVNLICAAPDLLAALEELLRVHVGPKLNDEGPSYRAVQQARAALAKAEQSA